MDFNAKGKFDKLPFFMIMRKIITYYSLILLLCSCVGFTGHYLQFGILRITPWIPAFIGILLLSIQYMKNKYRTFKTYLSLLILFALGILVLKMNWTFLFQDWQPLRKKIIFTVMSVSSTIALISILKTQFKTHRD